MRSLYYLLSTSIVIGICSCNKDEPKVPNSGIPLVTTLAPTNITENGVTFNLEVTGDISGILEYGFSVVAIEHSQAANNTSGKYSLEIVNDLPSGNQGVKGFIRTKDKTIFGQGVRFESLGVKAPKITGTSPNSVIPGDTLSISGSGFSSLRLSNSVLIDHQEVPIISTSTTALKVIVPEGIGPTIDIQVSTWYKTSDKYSLRVVFPIIESLRPSSQSMDQMITIIGKNFSSDILKNQVVFQNEGLNFNIEIVAAYKDSLQVLIPYLNTPHDTSFDVSITSNSTTSARSELFEFKRPFLFPVQDDVQYCDTLIIRGGNFSPIPDNNRLIYKSGPNGLEIISSTTSEIKLMPLPFIPLTQFNIAYLKGHVRSITNLTLLDGTLNEASPNIIENRSTIDLVVSGDNLPPFIYSSDYSCRIEQNNQTVIGQIEIIAAECDQVVIRIREEYFPHGISLQGIYQLKFRYSDKVLAKDIEFQIPD